MSAWRSRRTLVGLSIGLLLAACAAPEVREIPAGPRSLPATYLGDLPCADCAGLRYHLDLLEGGVYFLRRIYLDRAPGLVDDVGRWSVAPNGRALELRGAREREERFEIVDEVILRKLDLAGQPIASHLNYDLKRAGTFDPIEPALSLRGTYAYLADAGAFTECATGLRLPVAQEGDNAALEAAYSRARPAPGAAVLAAVDGRIAMRMPMEGPGPRPTLVVDRFASVSPDASCDAPPATAALEGTTWRLVRIGERPLAAAAEARREPQLILDPGEKRVSGSSGCNRFSGSYSLNGDRLGFGPLAATRMACADGMEQEQALFDALPRVARWRISSGRLELLDADGRSLAELAPSVQ
jgi:copper homeostasis protein (lipoprotein)